METIYAAVLVFIGAQIGSLLATALNRALDAREYVRQQEHNRAEMARLYNEVIQMSEPTLTRHSHSAILE